MVLANGGLLGHPDGFCFYCGRAVWKVPFKSHQKPNLDALTKDHVYPKSKGGVETVPACCACNHDKTNLSLEEYRVIRAFRAGLLPLPEYKFAAEAR